MNRTFTKYDSQVMKGIAILLMLVHHLFYSADSAHGLPVSYLFFTGKQVTAFARFCKICVPAFVFVTAYGMTLKYQAFVQEGKSVKKLTLFRYASLMISFLFVYVLAFLFCQIGGIRNWSEVYGSGGKSVLYALLDVLCLTYFTDTPTMNPTWWYMSVAVMLIFVMPLIWKITRKAGILPPVFLAAAMLASGLEKNQALLCILTAFIGCLCAEKDLFGRLEQWFRQNRKRGIFGVVLYAGLLFGMLFLKFKTGNRYWVFIYPVSAFALAGLLCRGNGQSAFAKALCFLGKYSMGMFLTHTFLKSYYLHDFIYGFRYPILIFIVLVLLSAALSVCLAFLENVLNTHRIEWRKLW